MVTKPKGSRFVLWFAGACLVAAVGVSMFAWNDDAQSDRPRLAAELPKQVAGWEGQDLPLGNTEVLNATEKLLNYDDYIYRVYRRDGVEVFLYAMYWRQGSISVREIAGHTPDGCWIMNGATFSAPRSSQVFQVGDRVTVMAERREFEFPSKQRVQVAWWHLWGNNIVDRSFDRKSLGPTLRELWVWLGQRHGTRRDQLLVRIHTSSDLDAAMKSEPVRAFLQMFPEAYTAKPLNNP